MNLLLSIALLLQDKTTEQLIEQLKSAKAEERLEARAALEKMGASAIPVLERSENGTDFATRNDLRQILDAIHSAPGWEVFKRIESTIEKAKTVSIKCTVHQGAESDSAGDMKGSIFLKGKDRIRVELTWVGKCGPQDILLVSDGRNTYCRPYGPSNVLQRDEHRFTFLPANIL